MSTLTTEELIKNLIVNIGENPDREGLAETPKRVAAMYEELLSGYPKNPRDIFKTFDGEKYKGTVKVENIFFSSLCEHHIIPFFGTVSITYRPNGKILGLSKFVRLVEIYSKRLQMQERLTQQIADTIMRYLKPKGCSVVIKAEHLCMSLRGVEKPGSYTVTECRRGDI